MIPIRKHRRGSATITALVSLGLVGATLAGLITRIGMEARRTQQEHKRAQHDQIIIAQSLGTAEYPVILPNELR